MEESQSCPDASNIWFDDVDPVVLEKALGIKVTANKPNQTDIKQVNSLNQMRQKMDFEAKKHKKQESESGWAIEETRATKCVALDCEMVGAGKDGVDDLLARVSIVNSFGLVLLDKYVKPTETVTDYRTAVSGIRKEDIENGFDFSSVQQEVADIIKNRTLVGHALHNDLKVLMLSHRKKAIRDTSFYGPLRELAKTRKPGLKTLAKLVLGLDIQSGEHSSIEDAQAAMKIYQRYKKDWEQSLKGRHKGGKNIENGQNTIALANLDSSDKKSGRQRWLEKRKQRQEHFKERRRKMLNTNRKKWKT